MWAYWVQSNLPSINHRYERFILRIVNLTLDVGVLVLFYPNT